MSGFRSEMGAPGIMRSRPLSSRNWLAFGATYGLLLSMIAGPLMSVKDRLSYTGEGNVSRQLMFIGVCVTAIGATRVGARPGRLFAIPFSLGITLGWCWLSLIWAQDPSVGVRRLLLTTVIMVTVSMLTPILKFNETIDIIKKVQIGVLIANYATVIFLPAVGIHRAAEVAGFGMDPDLIGSWKGILAHKNFAGSFAALTIIFFALDARRTRQSIRAIVIIMSAIFLYKTNSKTSAGILIISLMAGWIFTLYDVRYRNIIVPALLVGLGLVVLAGWVEWDSIIKPFNRPDAFTGRAQIWSVLIEYWRDHPWGSGYGSFWNVGSDRPIAHYVKANSWVALVPEAHNGYLDLLVQIGTFGLVLAVTSLFVVPLGKLLVRGTPSKSQGALLVALLIFCAGHNLTESSLLDRDAIVEMFLLFAIALIDQATAVASRPTPLSGALRHA